MLQQNKQKVESMILQLRKFFPTVKSALNYSTPLEFLIAVIMSAQTTDKQVNKVTANLFQKYKTINDYVKANPAEFEKDISSVNFYKNKAKNILAAVTAIREKYNGEVPDRMDDLLGLPGVGRKTANVVLGNIFKKPVGIAVDTHVRRLAKLYGLTIHDDPGKIEQDLMQIVPQKDWTDFTHLLIEYGREYCPARKHKHEECPLKA